MDEEEVSIFTEKPELKTLFMHKKGNLTLNRRPSDSSSLQNSSLKNSNNIFFNRVPSNFMDNVYRVPNLPNPSFIK